MSLLNLNHALSNICFDKTSVLGIKNFYQDYAFLIYLPIIGHTLLAIGIIERKLLAPALYAIEDKAPMLFLTLFFLRSIYCIMLHSCIWTNWYRHTHHFTEKGFEFREDIANKHRILDSATQAPMVITFNDLNIQEMQLRHTANNREYDVSVTVA